MTPSVTVVVCCYTTKRWADIRAGIAAAAAQSQRPQRIIVVVDHSDELLDLAGRELPALAGTVPIAVIANAHRQGLSGARNTAIAEADTEIVAFLDDDACPDEFWLQRLVAPFAVADVWATGGRSVPGWPGQRPAWFPAEFDWVVGSSYLGMPEAEASIRNVHGASMAFRAETFSRVGGFTEGFGRIGTLPLGCEETELCIRLRRQVPGADVRFVPSSTVLHRVSDDRVRYRYFVNRCYSEGISKAQISQVAGSRSSTEAERAYTAQVLPRGVLREVRGALRGRPSGLPRAATICVGFVVTAIGFVWGTLTLRLPRRGAPLG